MIKGERKERGVYKERIREVSNCKKNHHNLQISLRSLWCCVSFWNKRTNNEEKSNLPWILKCKWKYSIIMLYLNGWQYLKCSVADLIEKCTKDSVHKTMLEFLTFISKFSQLINSLIYSIFSILRLKNLTLLLSYSL